MISSLSAQAVPSLEGVSRSCASFPLSSAKLKSLSNSRCRDKGNGSFRRKVAVVIAGISAGEPPLFLKVCA